MSGLTSAIRRAVDPDSVPGRSLAGSGRAARRLAFIGRARAAAVLAGSSVRLRIADDADIATTIELDVWPGTSTEVVVGAGTRLGSHLRLSLRGGVLRVGAGADLRRLGTYHVGGRLTIGAGTVVSNGVCVHCASAVDVGDLTIIGEYTTIADSAHLRTPPGVPVHHSVEAAAVHIGTNIWIGAHAVIGSGVRVGDQAFVGAGAVVTSDVQPGWLVGGVPARPIKQL